MRSRPLISSTIRSRRQIFSIAVGVAVVVVLMLIRHHEIHGENLYYWFFARVLLETGGFPVFDRSPISALYLAPFQLLDYPLSFKLEYAVRAAFLFAALYTLTCQFACRPVAAFAALIWLPFLEDAAAFGQGVGLALVIFGLTLRIRDDDRRGSVVLFYALVLAAYLFRVTFLPMLLLFVVVDLFTLFRHQGRSGVLHLIPRPSDWPILVPVAFCAVSLMLQWDNPWNNVYAASTTWMPINNPKSLGEANTFQLINYKLTLQKFGTIFGHDWYVTNKVFFGDTATVADMLKANLPLVASLIDDAIPDLLTGVTGKTLLPRATHSENLVLISHFSVTLLVFCAALMRAARAPSNRGLFCAFVLGCAATMLPQLLGGGWVARHYGATVPVFILAGLYVGGAVVRALDREKPLDPLVFGMLAWLAVLYLGDRTLAWFAGARGFPLVPLAALAIVVVGIVFARFGPAWARMIARHASGLIVALGVLLFCDPAVQWAKMVRQAAADVAVGDLRILEIRPPNLSPNLVFRRIQPEVLSCKGVLALDHLFYASFLPMPIDRFYGAQDIPPIGKLGGEVPNPLTPDKVDCLLISETFRTIEGSGINIGLRYRNYVKPYEDKLLALGAEKRELPGYGHFVFLKSKP